MPSTIQSIDKTDLMAMGYILGWRSTFITEEIPLTTFCEIVACCIHLSNNSLNYFIFNIQYSLWIRPIPTSPFFYQKSWYLCFKLSITHFWMFYISDHKTVIFYLLSVPKLSHFCGTKPILLIIQGKNPDFWSEFFSLIL